MFAVIKVTLPFALYAISYSAFYKENSYTAERYLARLILCGVLVGLTECFSRYYYVHLVGHNIIQNFYLAKVYSPFFNDSNATALFLLTILFFTSTLNPYYKFRKLFIFITVALIILTLSRAAIAGAILFVMIEVVRKVNRIQRILISASIIPVLIGLVPFAYTLVSADGSGVTKLQVYDTFLTKISSNHISLSTIMFGDGMSQGALTYGYQDGKFSHALIPMLVGQIGIVGSSFWLIFVIFSLVKVKWHIVLTLFVCIFIPGLSYAHPFYEFFYIALGIASSTRSWKN